MPESFGKGKTDLLKDVLKDFLMGLMALGLNYQTAPIEIREKLKFADAESVKMVQDLLKEGLANEAILVSTCNRTELYYNGSITDETLHFIANKRSLPCNDLLPYIYTYSDTLAVRHLLRVACGLDSMVVGEVEILGQIKTAYRDALKAGALGRYLDRLFQYTFSLAKQVRRETGIGVNPVSVASLAVRLSGRIFSKLADATVLLIGAGHLIRLTAEHFKAKGVKKLIIANRTLSHSLSFKAKLGAGVISEVISLDEIPKLLSEIDIVVSGTGSELPIIGKGMVESALKQRKHRPMYMVDLAVPRDIESEVGGLEDVYLYCIDDLKTLALENRTLREHAARFAEEKVKEGAEQFMGWVNAKSAFQTVSSLRKKYEMSKQCVLSKGLQHLQQGKSPEIVLEHALTNLMNRFLHEPTIKLRKAGFEADTSIQQHIRYLFDLKI